VRSTINAAATLRHDSSSENAGMCPTSVVRIVMCERNGSRLRRVKSSRPGHAVRLISFLSPLAKWLISSRHKHDSCSPFHCRLLVNSMSIARSFAFSARVMKHAVGSPLWRMLRSEGDFHDAPADNAFRCIRMASCLQINRLALSRLSPRSFLAG